jgi:GTPase SAR1 family protein
LKSWLEEVKANGNPMMQIVLVGNKNDLKEKREVSYEDGEKMAKQH